MHEVSPWPFRAPSGNGPWWGSAEAPIPSLYFHEPFGKKGQRPAPSPRNKSQVGNVPWAAGRKGKAGWAGGGGQASGDRVVGSNKRWASPFRTAAILRAQALLHASPHPALWLQVGTRLVRGKWVRAAAKRVLVSWKPLPFTCYSEVRRRKAGCSRGIGGESWRGGVSEEACRESLPLVSSKKAGRCASAPCWGQTGSRSAPRVDHEGNEGEGVRGRMPGSSQK